MTVGDARGLVGVVSQPFDDITAYRLAAAYARVAPPLFTGSLFLDYLQRCERSWFARDQVTLGSTCKRS